MCTHCTRRQFLGASALSGMALAAGHLAAESDASSPSPSSKVRICAIVAGKPQDRSWGLSEADIAPMMKRLAEAEKNLGNVEFVIGQARTADETARLLEKGGPDAPVLAISAGIFGLSNFNRENSVMPAVFKEGRPAAVFHLPVVGGHDPGGRGGLRVSISPGAGGTVIICSTLVGIDRTAFPRPSRAPGPAVR